MSKATIDMDEVFQLTPSIDQGCDKPMVIYFHQMDHKLKMYVLRRIKEVMASNDPEAAGKEKPQDLFDLATELFSICVFRIDNFLDGKGNQILITHTDKEAGGRFRKVIEDKHLDRLKSVVYWEFFDMITDISKASEDQQKNS